jgi:hypothetical protein
LNGEDRQAWPRDLVYAAGGRVVSSSGTSVKRGDITEASNAAEGEASQASNRQ